MTTVAIYLDAHCTPGESSTFRGVCERVAEREPDTSIIHLHTGEELIDVAHHITPRTVDHLVIAAHGGTTWILDDQFGVTTGAPRYVGQVTEEAVADAWAPVLVEYPLISLAACMCSRAPSWWLRRKWGHIGSDWGARAYLPGGQTSFSARFRDALCWYGVYPDVRGHRTSGHTTYNPILAKHHYHAGEPCISWFHMEHPGVTPTRSWRRRWVREKKGLPAEAWLMGWDV
jgi:hypothetical protein